ncbi:hypothetical protein VB714_24720 [Spirulina sp. 06S082]|nr:hypothetical protein [Spirulina sp. 06S082]
MSLVEFYVIIVYVLLFLILKVLAIAFSQLLDHFQPAKNPIASESQF